MKRIAALLLFLALSTAGCASAPHEDTTPRTDRSVLTPAEIGSQHFANAYAAVEALRSNWLRERGTDSFSNPSVVLVYYDNVKLGGVETLRAIDTQVIASMRWFDALEATSRWGIGHGSGVIAITSWAAARPTVRDTLSF